MLGFSLRLKFDPLPALQNMPSTDKKNVGKFSLHIGKFGKVRTKIFPLIEDLC